MIFFAESLKTCFFWLDTFCHIIFQMGRQTTCLGKIGYLSRAGSISGIHITVQSSSCYAMLLSKAYMTRAGNNDLIISYHSCRVI